MQDSRSKCVGVDMDPFRGVDVWSCGNAVRCGASGFYNLVFSDM
jgi:hypothetical protein